MRVGALYMYVHCSVCRSEQLTVIQIANGLVHYGAKQESLHELNAVVRTEHRSADYSSQLVPPPLHGVSDHMTQSGRFGLAHRESAPKKKQQPTFPQI